RLKMFTYEASYYASLFVPVFFYFFLGWVLKRHKLKLVYLIPALALPLIFSFSLGVLSVMVFSLVLVFLIYGFYLLKRRRILYLLFWIFLAVLPAVLLLSY